MKSRYLLLAATSLIVAVLIAGCTGNVNPGTATTSPATPVPSPSGTVAPVTTLYASPAKISTTPELVAFVANAAAYARENGKEKAISSFNDPNGTFISGNMHIFAIDYNGNVLADALEPGIVGTNILNMTDPFGTPLVQNLAETARFGRGYVSYSYPNAGRNQTVEPQIAVAEDVDGTYYVAAGMFASEGAIYPSVVLNTSGTHPGVDDLVAYVKSAVTYARANGKEKALQAFSDPKGQFVQGELVMMAFDYNGTNLAAPPYSPELTKYRINLLNYNDPDGVDTIRGMRDIAREGGGFFYTVANVKVNGKEVYMPKIDYAEPVDGDWWIFSGIIVPGYGRNGSGDLTGIQVRNRTRADLYDLVDQAVAFAKTTGRVKTLAEINNSNGQFVHGDLFVWAESSNGTLLADPFWKSGIGRNQIDYTDRYGMKTTRVGIEAMENGTGFSHALFPNTAANGTADVPKLIYMKAVDDTWWIGGGVYGVEVK
jgi:signal transduction histidine kinase